MFSFNPLVPTYWHQEEPLGWSVFTEPNYLFKEHTYITAYLTLSLQAS